jgi:hypothetical protein
MKYNKKFAAAVIGVVASVMFAGTILAPTQSYGDSGRFIDTTSLKNAIRDGISVHLQHSDQHMNQLNLCYRSNECRQSNVGQETLGNDNQVTGFTDQSDNTNSTE